MSATGKLQESSRSMWLKGLDREAIVNGRLQHLIDEGAVHGIVCDSLVETRAGEAGASMQWPANAIADAQYAADLLRPRFALTEGRDGYVSLPLPPDCLRFPRHGYLQARSLWTLMARPNILISVPGVRTGLPLMRDLIANGVNVNATLLFGSQHCKDAFDAYYAGLQARLAKERAVSHITFIVSFDVQAVDRQIDAELQALLQTRPSNAAEIAAVVGRGGVAHATVIQHRLTHYARSEKFALLARYGASLPRLFWSLAENADPRYSIEKYLLSLPAYGVIYGLPPLAFDDFFEQGVFPPSPAPKEIEEEFLEALNVLVSLRTLGIDAENIAHQLQRTQAFEYAANDAWNAQADHDEIAAMGALPDAAP